MSTFKTFFMAMTPDERERYAASAGTTVGTLQQVVYANKRIELGFADALIAVAGDKLKLDDMPLTDRAMQQRAIREGAGKPAPEVPAERVQA